MSAAAAAPISVKVFSDVACPYCWIGLKKFQEGAKASGVEVNVELHAYMLNPNAAPDFNMPLHKYLTDIRGLPEARLAVGHANLTAEGKKFGCEYNFETARAASTLAAHRLIHYAREQGKSVDVKEKLLSAFFSEGKHVGTTDVLIDVAKSAGLDPVKARAALDDPKTLAGVQEDIKIARAIGINGVPHFIIDDKFSVSGAQDPATFAAALKKAAASK